MIDSIDLDVEDLPVEMIKAHSVNHETDPAPVAGPPKTLEITENGDYDVLPYQVANVNVNGGLPDRFLNLKVTNNRSSGSSASINAVYFENAVHYPDNERDYPYMYEATVSGNGNVANVMYHLIDQNAITATPRYITVRSRSSQPAPTLTSNTEGVEIEKIVEDTASGVLSSMRFSVFILKLPKVEVSYVSPLTEIELVVT